MDERDYSAADMDIDSEMFDEDEMDPIAQLNVNNVIQPMSLFKLQFQNDNLNSRNNVRAMIDEYNLKIEEETERYNPWFSEADVETFMQTKVIRRTTSLYHGNSSFHYDLLYGRWECLRSNNWKCSACSHQVRRY